MDTNDSQTWTIGGYNKKYGNDYFCQKNSTAESSDYSEFNDSSPAPTKSRAALILTEVEEQLEIDETEYEKVKNRFQYYKSLYLGAGISSEISDTKIVDKPEIIQSNLTRDSISNSPLEDEKKSEDHEASEKTQYYDFYTETKRATFESTEQSPKYSARSYKVSPRQEIYLGGQDENSSDSGHQNYFLEQANVEDKNVVHEKTSENAVINDDNQIHEDHEFSDISTSHQHPYQFQLAEYSKSIHEEMKNNCRDSEKLPLEHNQEICFNDFPKSSRNQDENRQLFLNLSESLESLQTMKNKKSRSEKHRKINGSVTSTNKKNQIVKQQVDDTFCGVTKIRRKKRKLVRASNSRSTTATRDNFLTGENKKDTRKRKQRGHVTIPASESSQNRQEISTKISGNSRDVVEIYHNTSLKSGSLSVISSKHSRHDSRGRNVASANLHDQRSALKNNRQLVEDNQRMKCNIDDSEIRRSLKSQKKSQRIDDETCGNLKISQQDLQNDNDLRSGEPNRTKLNYKPESETFQTDNKIHVECNNYQLNHRNPEYPERSSAYYDTLAIRNYELPTVASKMKRVNRSYFNRFNFRNIPFVVGTSVTPSYNLGLNIQETLSLMKTRQTMPGGVTPLLISKVSKGVQPVSTLLGCIENSNEMPIEESDTRYDATSARIYNYYPEQIAMGNRNPTATMQLGAFSLQTPRITCISNTHQSFIENQQTCAKIIEVPTAKKQKTQSICSSMKINSRKNVESHLQLTPSVLLKQRQDELNIGFPQNTKNRIQEVLINFHDKFEAMNIKYEKLLEQAEKSNDESLKKEIATLEKELTCKEEEINAVVNLYKEVMALKQQMKQHNEKNSLVFVATESPGSPMYPEMTSRAQTANPVMLNAYRRNGSGSVRGPSTSTRLAGLLRQIKIFQKQLKSVS